MGGEIFPSSYGEPGDFWRTVAHDPAAVQLHHRLSGYFVFVAAWGFLVIAHRGAAPTGHKRAAALLAAAVTGQLLLGIVTLLAAAPAGLGVAHQAGAVLTLAAAVVLAWTARRSGPEAGPGAADRKRDPRRVDVQEQNLAIG
jgi:cytochrome c oxidase assembly protein subunit 15